MVPDRHLQSSITCSKYTANNEKVHRPIFVISESNAYSQHTLPCSRIEIPLRNARHSLSSLCDTSYLDRRFTLWFQHSHGVAPLLVLCRCLFHFFAPLWEKFNFEYE